MFTLLPISGNIFDTIFTISSNSLSDYHIDWGDGIVTPIADTHFYTQKGIYNVRVIDCDTLSSFSLTAFSPFFEDVISVTYDSASAFTGCLTPFTINLSADSQNTTVNLYASGSRSNPSQSDTTFWQHLTPEWAFYDSDFAKITSLNIEGVPVYSGTMVVGFTAMSSVYFKDDMPNQVDLFFTIPQNNVTTPINSRTYAAFPFSIEPSIPTRLNITLDGLDDFGTFQWSDVEIPVVITATNDLSCSSIMHYASGHLINIQADSSCYGISTDSIDFLDGFSIPCLTSSSAIIKSTIVSSSAFLPDQIQSSIVRCGENPEEQYQTTLRRSPRNMTLTATAIFDVNGTTYTLTGQSNPFNVYKFENYHEFYRKGEETSLYDLIKRFSHFDLDQLPMLNSYLSAIAGPGDTFGKVYDKVVNFGPDHSDIDLCQIDSIYDIASKIDETVLDFGLEFPEELKRFLNISSISLNKLTGIRPYRDGKVSELLSDNSLIMQGEIIAYKNNSDEYYNFYESPITTRLNNLSSLPIGDFCFYRWESDSRITIVDSVINYDDPRNKLDVSLIDSESWYGDEGILEETLNYILTKNLLNS